MGTPTRARVLHDDGTDEILLDAASVAVGGDAVDGRIELLYDYRPELLPGGAWQGDGMWRYRSLLPVGDGPIVYPLAVGATPLIGPPVLRETVGMPSMWLKDETRGPSASNKDRATALVLQQAMASGVRRVTCASTGNVAVSLAIGAAAAGVEAIVFVGAAVAEPKLRLMLQAGATVVRVRGSYEDAFRLSRAAARRFGWLERNTGVNPATIDAKKTVALEIWEQLGRSMPDAVVVPVGDGPTLCGLAKGFREVVACGGADHVPRLIGVQAEGCQPVKRAWETGRPLRPARGETIADGIAVGNPVSGAMAVREVAESRGAFVSVSDAQMLDAMTLLATRAGVLAEPAAAASLAGLGVALRTGLVRPTEQVVLLVTGSALKTPGFVRPNGRVLEADASLDALHRLLE